MKIGIFGSVNDIQCITVKNALEKLGLQTIIVEADDINLGKDFSFDMDNFFYKGQSLEDVGAWYLKNVISTFPDAFGLDYEYYLYKDWLINHMRKTERLGFQLSMLMYFASKKIPVINPPENGNVIQLKPFQLASAKNVGLTIPQTLISNNPERVIKFISEVKDVVYKPSMGGGLCHHFKESDFNRLDHITKSPVTFQERITGSSVRATIINNEVVSCVLLPSDYVDYRNDPNYNAGNQRYEEIDLPKEVAQKTFKLLENCGLVFSGVDFVLNEKKEFVFLEANSSPIYLDIEYKTGVPISAKLASLLIHLANYPDLHQNFISKRKEKSFVSYGFPFEPDLSIGGPYE